MPTGTLDWNPEAYGALPLPHVGWGRSVLDRLRPVGPKRVLDLGCGTGRDAAVLLTEHPDCWVLGVDASPAMLRAAARTLPTFGDRARLMRADLREPFTLPEPFDAALSVAALHWIVDHRPVFASVAAALRSGGRFVAECGGDGNVARVREALRRVTGDGGDEVWHFALVSETWELLAEAGFGDISVRLRPEPLRLDPNTYPTYLATVVMAAQLHDVDPAERPALVAAVARAVGEPIVDYVRIEFEAVKV